VSAMNFLERRTRGAVRHPLAAVFATVLLAFIADAQSPELRHLSQRWQLDSFLLLLALTIWQAFLLARTIKQLRDSSALSGRASSQNDLPARP